VTSLGHLTWDSAFFPYYARHSSPFFCFQHVINLQSHISPFLCLTPPPASVNSAAEGRCGQIVVSHQNSNSAIDGSEMQRRPNRFNSKRKMHLLSPELLQQCAVLSESVRYGGNPEHKKNPGDFGLTPPSAPRTAKSLCDSVAIFKKSLAMKYLKRGLKRGLVSEQIVNGWPQNIWSLTDSGYPIEAQLENSETGVYHGYPMPESDPFSVEVVAAWKARNV